ncbi:TrkA family potassium uptake protein [Palleronia sediminis]|uniref:TrkA family potassium uptake protein n=1 Tax=Palleronia sediminis TaxID=2547833 RepID=A0A4R6AJI0_9RHOB|nr:TrkA family potassium uptake protein [Palleronia sediminis]TDL81573.1 TrkA family potassium uptake protein [Palleronia sediminis]
MPRDKMTFLVIGLGNFGAAVAKDLKRFGNYVIGVDTDESIISDHAEQLDQALILDARDEHALREIGAADCDVGVVGLGHDLEASVLATMNLRLVGVDKIWAKASSKTHHRILTRLGADRVIHPEERVGKQVAQMLHNPLIRDYVSLGNSYHVVNLRIPDELNGKSTEALNLAKFDLRCLGIMRGTEFLAYGDETVELEGNDMLLVLGKRGDLRAFTSSIG